MITHFSNNLRILVAKKETVFGEAEGNFDGNDFNVRVWEPTITPTVETDDEASKFATGDHGECESVMGAQSATIDFSVKMNSYEKKGDKFVSPSWLKFARACGCKVTRYGAAAASEAGLVGYSLRPKKERDIHTLTIRVYDIPRNETGPAACYVFAGCMGNMTIGAEGVGKPWTATFSFTGKLVDIEAVTDRNAVPMFSAKDGPVAEKLLNYELDFDGMGEVSQKISTFSLDVGNEISPLLDQAEASGYAYYSITKRSPRFSCNPLVNGSFVELYNAWKASDTFSVTMRPSDSTTEGLGGFKLTIPRAQQLTAAVASREGLVNWDLNLKALRNETAAAGEREDTWKLVVGQDQAPAVVKARRGRKPATVN